MHRSRSGSARSKCSAMNVGRSIELGSTVIVVISFSRAFAGLLKDHAVAVAMSGRHAHTGPVLHHVPGLNCARAEPPQPGLGRTTCPLKRRQRPLNENARSL